ncbi:MAG: cytochrome c oxidase assembly protein, partial [Burkholderiaceae bacterium]|nr:cytochrome c oxidase assembly protein [Burkholderiaceae bacterium]
MTKAISEGSLLRKLNSTMLGKLIFIAVLMFGFGYALVPVYRKICELTGVNVLAQQEGSGKAPKNLQVDASREVTVEFDANTTGPWRFRPVVSSMKVHPGEMAQVV